jgi:hypothetical protein
VATVQGSKWTPGGLVRARGRDWVVLPPDEPDVVRLRPVDGSDTEAVGIYLPLEPEALNPSEYQKPDSNLAGDRTRHEPLDEEISAGKNTYTYDAHTYHTKVPPQGIANVISKYLPEGGVVLDPFAGSGMTGVAARYLGHDVILNELSPAAAFISFNFLASIDTEQFRLAVSQVLTNLHNLQRTLYLTRCRECGSEVVQLYTVWSYVLECDHCEHDFV